MNFKFGLGAKIGVGFGVLIFLTIIVFYLTNNTLDSSRKINDEIIHVHSPSVDALQEVKALILESKDLIYQWTTLQGDTRHPKKQKLITLVNESYPKAKVRVNDLSNKWREEDKKIREDLFGQIENLYSTYSIVQEQLTSFDSYEDPEIKFYVDVLVEDGGEIDMYADQILTTLDDLILHHRGNTEQQSTEMISSFDLLESVVKNLGMALFIGGILIAFFTVRTIVKPVHKLKDLLLLLGKGVIPREKMEPRNDEIGEMSLALNDLVDGFKRTTEFAKNVGSGNFESEYQPLSDEDSLGHSLLAMRTDLHDLTSNLELKVKERTEEVVRQKGELEKQKHEIEELLKEVTDSIHYAKRIQNAILPPDSYMKRLVEKSFVLFKPKDIVSGDFYWASEIENKAIFAAVDCTGHGVPGALMTIVGYNNLNQSLARVTEPNAAKLLDGLNEGVIETFSKEKGAEVKDGMDAAVCIVDKENKELQYAGAFNPLYIVRKGSQEIEQVKADKFPIGNFIGGDQKFTNHTFQFAEGDTVYIFSDGYADQFGGPKGKKYRYKNFRDLLLSVQDKSMDVQRKILDDSIEQWRGDLEQIDDILVIGIRF